MSAFTPPRWLRGRHAQTVWGSLFRFPIKPAARARALGIARRRLPRRRRLGRADAGRADRRRLPRARRQLQGRLRARPSARLARGRARRRRDQLSRLLGRAQSAAALLPFGRDRRFRVRHRRNCAPSGRGAPSASPASRSAATWSRSISASAATTWRRNRRRRSRVGAVRSGASAPATSTGPTSWRASIASASCAGCARRSPTRRKRGTARCRSTKRARAQLPRLGPRRDRAAARLSQRRRLLDALERGAASAVGEAAAAHPRRRGRSVRAARSAAARRRRAKSAGAARDFARRRPRRVRSRPAMVDAPARRAAAPPKVYSRREIGR